MDTNIQNGSRPGPKIAMPAFFRFTPLFKERIWGGDRLLPFKGGKNPEKAVGESWEISGVPGDETRVCGGPCDNWTLSELIACYGTDLTGDFHVESEGPFPLLVKFIDTAQDLSIQVHPDDSTARRQGKHCGKTEMWYIVDAEPGASLLVGFNCRLTPDEYEQSVKDNTICDKLVRYPVKQGDCFYIPAGQVHAIGAGIMLIEIQQASDTTYRIYDYNRLGYDGKPRMLHTQEAREAIDFEHRVECPTKYDYATNRRVQLESCPFYTTSRFDLDAPYKIDYSRHTSFALLIAYEGQAEVRCNGEATVLKAGETLLIPAVAREVEIIPEKNTLFRFLETYV